MVNSNFFRRLSLKILIAKFLARLEDLSQLYNNVDEIDYLQKMDRLIYDMEHVPSLTIGAEHLLGEARASIAAGASNRVNAISQKIHDHLNWLFDSTNLVRVKSSRLRKLAIMVIILVIGTLIVTSFKPLSKIYVREQEEYRAAMYGDEFKQKTLNDILALRDAIQNYYSDHRSYPKSSGEWDAIKTSYGKSREDWIPGLAPKYIKELPADPRNSSDPGEQYMYKSDGVNFKLIAHHPLGMKDVIAERPELVDPVRSSWAFGVWTNDAKNW